MSAQRRTANKRAGAATGTRATASVPVPTPAAPARPAATAPASPPRNAPRGAAERPEAAAPAPATPGRGEAVAERTAGVRKLVRDTMTELRKVNWPDQETTRNLTVVVIGISTAIGLALGGIDFVLLKLLEAIP